MSQENEEIVRHAMDLWSTGGDLEGLRQFFDPDVLVVAPVGWPDGPESRGIDAWASQAESLRDTWEEARMEIEEIHSVGVDRVVTHLRYMTRGKDDGLQFDTPVSAVFFFKEGKVMRAQYFWDKAEALEAAGLQE